MIKKELFYILYNKNSPRNKNKNYGPLDARIFLRDLSLPVAYFLAKVGIKPHTVTTTFLIISIVANIIFIIPSIYTLIILIIFHEIAQLLDCVDGQLARYQGISSKFGERLDSLAHSMISGTFMLAFGIRLYLQNNEAMVLILGSIGAFAKAFEHQFEIDRDLVLDTVGIKRFYYKSKILQNLIYFIQSMITEIRIFAFMVLIMELIFQGIVNINIESVSFSVLVLFSFLESVLYKTFITYKQLRFVEFKTWKGW